METPFKDARKHAYLNAEGADRPLISPIPAETVAAARAYRLGRFRAALEAADVAGLLMYDPINIRYAFDSSNMQVWTAHNPIRYGLILNGGPGILYEFAGCDHVNDGLSGIDEIRTSISYMFMNKGDKAEGFVEDWADDLVSNLPKGARLAVDKLDPHATRALEARGIRVLDGTAITETARSIKSADEIALMRWTIRVCEAGMARIYEHSVPGATERELWAHLHFENARSGGDWLESKLLTAGANTNPWYRECSDYRVKAGEMISFDTEMIGPYGYCADISRSWVCGYHPMNTHQRRLYRLALEQVEHNVGLLKPGLTFSEFNAASWRIPERHQPYRYSLALHGVGMADEWPVVPLHCDWTNRAMAGVFEPGMVVCVESLMAEAGSESIKLETQVLITETGAERLDTFPWEDV